MRESKKPDVRRKEIIDTSIEIFLEKGYEKTTITDIANKMKVSQGLFYRYFLSKEEVFKAALDEYVNEGIIHYSKLLLDRKTSISCKLLEFSRISSNNSIDSNIGKFYNLNGDIQMKVLLQLNLMLVLLVTKALEIANSKEEIKIKIEDIPFLSSFIIYGQLGIVLSTEASDEQKKIENLKIIEKLLNLKVGVIDA